MLLSYVYNILKVKKWELFCFVTILIGLRWCTVRPDINHLTELHKCPVCFGTSACNYLNEVDINLHDFHSIFSYFFGVKNVFFGSFNKTNVMLKKLAQTSELNEFDRLICENKYLSGICIFNTKPANSIINTDFRTLLEEEVNLNLTTEKLIRLGLCPSTEHLNNLLERVYQNNEDPGSKVLDINIWVLAALNPEPLVLQILSADEGWPVPKYFGACGRIVIEEYIGLPLSTYYNKPWIVRAKITSSILKAAYLFTYKNEDFGFYLTDISVDNIAVDLNNDAKFVDLENLIVVDKNIASSDKPATWNELQVNTEDFSCSECLAFTSADICSHKISDHNYYAICKILLGFDADNTIFPGGFLHDIPTVILENYPSIQYLIQQCITPQIPFNRIQAGIQLKELLDVILENHS